MKSIFFIIVLSILLFTSFSGYSQEINKTPIAESEINDAGLKKTKKIDKLKNTFYQGDIGIGYEYGLLPILVNPSPPNSNSKIQGSLGFKISILPFKTSFLYSTASTASGLNNYFTLEFDVEKFLQILREEKMKKEKAIMAKKDSLLQIKQNIIKKIAFYEMAMKGKIVDADAIKKQAQDSLKNKINNKDSLHKDSGRTILYSKRDEMYLIRKDKKCIKDSLKENRIKIKQHWKGAKDSIVMDSLVSDSLNVNSKKEELKVAKSNKKLIMDSLEVYRVDVKNKLKKKELDDKKEKKELRKSNKKKKKKDKKDKKDKNNKLALDSLKDNKVDIDTNVIQADSLKQTNKLDSLNDKKNEAYEMTEASKKEYNELKAKLKNVDKELSKLEMKKLAELEDEKEGFKQKKKGKFITYLSYIKKFELGSINPSHSYLLANNLPMTGINVEYNQNKMYVAFTHGKTINNIFLTSNIIQNSIYKAKNLYNFFDFTNIDEGRRVTALKVGYGEKENSHLFVGGMYGVGKINYNNQASEDKERNYVFEIDGKWVINEKHTIDGVYGRSALQIDQVNYSEQSSVFSQLLGFNDRVNAAMFQSNSSFFKNKTTLKLTYRIIDPFFKSFGVGFLRNDNIRYEGKIKQKLSKKITVGGFVRREEDNLLNMYAYKNLLMGYGLDLTYRLTKKTTLKADYRPIIQKITFKDENIDITNNNQIINLIATHNNRIKNTTFNITGIYSLYNLQNDSTVGIYHNYNVSSTINYKNKWEEMLSYNRFQSNDTSSATRTDFFQNDFTFKMKRLDLTLVAKYSISDRFKPQVGYGLRAKFKITNNIYWSLSGEKLILGDYYNSLAITGADNYPYYYYTSINWVW